MTDKVSNFTRGTDISTDEAERTSRTSSPTGSPANTELATKAAPLPSHDLVAVRREQHARWQLRKLYEKFPERKGIIEPLLQRLDAENPQAEAVFLLADDERLLGFACGRGDAALLDILLANGISPNHGMAFADACRRGDSACLKVFLSHGANVNGQFDGTSPLGLAAASGSLDSVKLLLDNGADAGSLGIRYLQTPQRRIRSP
jgi:hypothetical protein